MGTEYLARCNKCKTEFMIREGGGFTFHLLHCNECGTEKGIGLKELGEIHTRFVKGLDIPYSSVSANADRDIQGNSTGSPITAEQYYSEIERVAGNCFCGGHYKLNAKARCPKCRSNDYLNTDTHVTFYD